MVAFNIIFGFSFAILVSLINSFLAIKTYNTIKHVYVVGQLLQLIWALLLPVTNILLSDPRIYNITGISGTIAFSLSLLVNHFYFDDITALYRQRKTMILGGLAFGGVTGFILHDGGIEIKGNGVIELSTPVLVLLLLQGGLLIHRVNDHLINQNSLSEHYALKSRYSNFVEKYGKFILVGIFLVSLSLTFSAQLEILFITSFLIPLGYVTVTIALYSDPLSSTTVGQKVQAVAILSGGKTKYLHVLASSGKSVVNNEDFSLFLNDINNLMIEIAKSETSVKSISTKDVLVMFEPFGEDILIFILQYRAPILRKTIQQMAHYFNLHKVKNQDDFSSYVEKALLGTKQDLRIISLVNKSWVIITNKKSASFKKALGKWDLYLQRGTQIEITDFSVDWIKKENPTHAVAIGGDGTVHSIVNTIISSGHELPIGILPGGGGNDISRRWSDIHKLQGDNSAIKFLSMPLMELIYPEHHEYIVNTLEWGVGAPTAQLREENHGKFLFGTAKYFYLVMKALNKFRSWRSEVIIDGSIKSYEKLSALILGFGNSSLGGGFTLFPEEMDKDQLMFVMTAKNYDRFHGFKILLKLLRGTHFKEKNIEYFNFNELNIEPMDDNIVVLTVDGELKEKPPVKVKLSDKSITTFVIV